MQNRHTFEHPFKLSFWSSVPKGYLTTCIISLAFCSMTTQRKYICVSVVSLSFSYSTWRRSTRLNMSNLLRLQILSMLENYSFQKLGIFSILNEEHDSRIVNITIFLYVQHTYYNKTEPTEILASFPRAGNLIDVQTAGVTFFILIWCTKMFLNVQLNYNHS